MAYKKNRYGSIVLTDNNGKEFTITQKEQREKKTYVKRANQRRLDKGHRYYDDLKGQTNMKGISFESYMSLMPMMQHALAFLEQTAMVILYSLQTIHIS